MTKQHFIRAAEIVRAIHDGHWTNEFPCWADNARNTASDQQTIDFRGTDAAYTRAVQTAESFLTLFREYNPRFDQQRFLKACGLA